MTMSSHSHPTQCDLYYMATKRCIEELGHIWTLQSVKVVLAAQPQVMWLQWTLVFKKLSYSSNYKIPQKEMSTAPIHYLYIGYERWLGLCKTFLLTEFSSLWWEKNCMCSKIYMYIYISHLRRTQNILAAYNIPSHFLICKIRFSLKKARRHWQYSSIFLNIFCTY